MEVHTHTHTARKKWTHYFWEFFMLFLAVTLGFFVENQREHFIEHKREIQFINSLIEDVALDTNELNQIHQRRVVRETMLDSLVLLLNSPDRNEHMVSIYYFGRHIQRLFPLSFTYHDRTIQQLKNSGNLRLIRNHKAANEIVLYDARVRDMEIIEEREYQYLYLCLPYVYKIFDGLVFQQMTDSVMRISAASPDARLLNTAHANIPEFNAALYSLKIANNANMRRAKALIEDGERLLNSLKKEYHLPKKTPLDK